MDIFTSASGGENNVHCRSTACGRYPEFGRFATFAAKIRHGRVENGFGNMKQGNWKGHLALGLAYTIFGINLVTSKDIANADAVTPIALFTMRAVGATALFWLISLFLPKEKVGRDMGKSCIASVLGLFIPPVYVLEGRHDGDSDRHRRSGTLSPIFTLFIALFRPERGRSRSNRRRTAQSLRNPILIYNSVHALDVEATTPAGYAC